MIKLGASGQVLLNSSGQISNSCNGTCVAKYTSAISGTAWTTPTQVATYCEALTGCCGGDPVNTWIYDSDSTAHYWESTGQTCSTSGTCTFSTPTCNTSDYPAENLLFTLSGFHWTGGCSPFGSSPPDGTYVFNYCPGLTPSWYGNSGGGSFAFCFFLGCVSGFWTIYIILPGFAGCGTCSGGGGALIQTIQANLPGGTPQDAVYGQCVEYYAVPCSCNGTIVVSI